MSNIIEIKDLCFEYSKGHKTLDNISFNVKKGDYVAILGHNGSGKSTIAKLLIGLLEANSGQIIVDNLPLNLDNLYQIRDRIGIVFQNPDNQFIGATVQDDIAFGLENTCVPTEDMQPIINEFASKVGMQDFLLHEPTKLSGGQKQRVAIAGVLAMNPKIIILDEATSMLDPIGKREINTLVNKLNKQEETTIISITHDIEEAKNASHVILLHDGHIIDCGNPKDILTNQERMQQLALDIPFALKISRGLKDVLENKEIQDIDQLAEELCQLYLNK
ncbi:energy-coupling factor transporter ATPase [Tannockella kyphosi]|uniref:energy-coupling factor transporter ATPase n=1 Tax=Tannockella kyphosi TaxID=2899121 RepID=UPI00201263A3|nr:energy-coupling factor transporter ATPase [Tannockella kyphosi]